jgi:hypothetical protein
MNKEMIKLLNESFDRELSPHESAGLYSALQQSPELRAEKEKIAEVRNLLKNHKPDFKPGFAEKIIQAIGHERKTEKLTGIIVPFNRIALPVLAAAAILLLFTLFADGNLSIDAIMGIDQLEPEYLSEFLLFNF